MEKDQKKLSKFSEGFQNYDGDKWACPQLSV